MNLNKWFRQTHRWLSVAFTLGFIANIFNVAGGHPAFWMYFLAIIPLFLLLFTGVYLFALPYFPKSRVRQGAG
jgi:hypothetical protein